MGGSAEPTIDARRSSIGRRLASTRRPRESSSTAAGLERTPWLSRLHRALREERFVLHYQPIVSMHDGRVAHYEALVRLVDADGAGLLAPAAFLPAAERYGIISAIDRAVLDKALAAVAELPAPAARTRIRRRAHPHARGTAVAVNLSALSLTDPGMLSYLQGRLAHHAVAGEALVLEVTETASISDMALAREFCAGAAALGCELALDDFGSGFGSFHYLRHLDFAYLKIDGGFIRGLCGSATDRRVVFSLVALARGMGARTVAEYVQDARTLTLLRELGVDYAQGFAVGRPGPLPALA